MSSVWFHSSVTAEEMSFGEVAGDGIVFRGQASERSSAVTERRNLPPAVTPHRTYTDVRVDLHVEAEIDDEAVRATEAEAPDARQSRRSGSA